MKTQDAKVWVMSQFGKKRNYESREEKGEEKG